MTVIRQYDENNNLINENNNIFNTDIEPININNDSDSESSEEDDDLYDEISHYESLALLESGTEEEYEVIIFQFEQYKDQQTSQGRWGYIDNNSTIYYWAKFLLEKWYVTNTQCINLLDESNNIRKGYFDNLGVDTPSHNNSRHWRMDLDQDQSDDLIHMINNYNPEINDDLY